MQARIIVQLQNHQTEIDVYDYDISSKDVLQLTQRFMNRVASVFVWHLIEWM